MESFYKKLNLKTNFLKSNLLLLAVLYRTMILSPVVFAMVKHLSYT